MIAIPTQNGASGRRSFLAIAGGVASIALAGCLGDGSDGDVSADPQPTSTSSDADTSCEGLEGPFRDYHPDGRRFPYLFSVPETFEEYNAEINESDSSIGAQFGYVERQGGSYPVNFAIYQQKFASTDADANEMWVTTVGQSERLGWAFPYRGDSVEGYGQALEGDDSAIWTFLLPAHETDGYRGIRVLFQDTRSEESCLETLEGIVKAVLESLSPNPGYTEPSG